MATYETQIEILPASEALSFQSGYLGADDERASMEGEVHLKAAGSGWEKLSVSPMSLSDCC